MAVVYENANRRERPHSIATRDVVVLPSGKAASLIRIFPSEIISEADAVVLADALHNRIVGMEIHLKTRMADLADDPNSDPAWNRRWEVRTRTAIEASQANLDAVMRRLNDLRELAFERRFVKLAKQELPAVVYERIEEKARER